MTNSRLAVRVPALILALAALGSGCGGSSSPSPSPTPVDPSGCTSGATTTQLQVTNGSAQTVPVMITLGKGQTPASDYGVKTISQLPAAWTTYPDPTAPTTQATFLLPAGQSLCFNSGTLSFAGNVAFGPAFDGRGCGGDATTCYPDAATFFEFALNLGGSGWETVDLSGVNGTNALITANLSAPAWTNSVTTSSVTTISNPAIGAWTPGLNGVYGWQSTNCTSAVNPPNPLPPPPAPPTCAAPLHAPAATQNQAQAICNIQRAAGATGGTVQVVFNGYAPGSAPGSRCVGGFGPFLPVGTYRGGTQVTMTGFGLDKVTAVTIQQVNAPIVGTPTDTQLVVTTPAYAYCSINPNASVQFTLADGSSFTPTAPAYNYTYDCTGAPPP